jgi:hypothetical protein
MDGSTEFKLPINKTKLKIKHINFMDSNNNKLPPIGNPESLSATKLPIGNNNKLPPIGNPDSVGATRLPGVRESIGNYLEEQSKAELEHKKYARILENAVNGRPSNATLSDINIKFDNHTVKTGGGSELNRYLI